MSSGIVNFSGGNVSAQGSAPSFGGPGGLGAGGDFTALLKEMIQRKWEEKQRRMADEENLRRSELARQQAEEGLRMRQTQAASQAFDPRTGTVNFAEPGYAARANAEAAARARAGAQNMLGAADPDRDLKFLQKQAAMQKLREEMSPAPMKMMHSPGAMGVYYVPDETKMSAYQRQMFLPKEATFAQKPETTSQRLGAGLDAAEDERFYDRMEAQRAARRGGLGSGGGMGSAAPASSSGAMGSRR